MLDCSVVTLDIDDLLGLSGLDVLDVDACLLGPCHQCATDIFRAIIAPDYLWFAAPFNNPVQAANNPPGGQREVHLNAQSLAVKVIQHVQFSDTTAIHQLVNHKGQPTALLRFWIRRSGGVFAFGN